MSNKQIITPPGIAVWPKVNEPDTKFDPDGVYECKIRVSPSDALKEIRDQLQELGEAKLAELKKENAKKYNKYKVEVSAFQEDEDEEGNETGDWLVRARQKAKIETKAGKIIEKHVILKDSQGKRVDVLVGGGSKVRMGCEPNVAVVDGQKTIFVTLRLIAVQIIDLVTFGEKDVDFDAVEDGYVGEEVSDDGGDEPDDDTEETKDDNESADSLY